MLNVNWSALRDEVVRRSSRIPRSKCAMKIHPRGLVSLPACSSLVLAVCLCLLCFGSPARAATTVSGDVTPADPADWPWSGSVRVGETGSGSVIADNGSALLSSTAYIGRRIGSTGEVTVDGAGSMWTNNEDVYVGREGSGILNITGGGATTVGVDTWVAYGSGLPGTVSFAGYPAGDWVSHGFDSSGATSIPGLSGTINFNNGILTTGGLICNTDDLTGTGTINTGGLVSDLDLVFNAASGLSQTLSIADNPGQNITVNLTADGSGSTGAGHSGVGTMSISDGLRVESVGGYIGFNSGSAGEVTVSDAGSTWAHSSNLWVGRRGSGVLNITGSAAVTVEKNTWVAYGSASSGAVNFDGGILTTGGLICNTDDLTGTGTINTGGLVSDLDLVFNAASGLSQTFSIADNPGQNITVNLTVDGSGSLGVGHSGSATMSISDGLSVESIDGYIGFNSGSAGEVTVSGAGSTWTNDFVLRVGDGGSGVLNITDGGRVSTSYLLIDGDGDGDSFVNMASGGSLVLYGEADGSLAEFLYLVDGTDAIRYWDASASAWADISGATEGEDYTLVSFQTGSTHYTELTVVPEPATAVLLCGAGAGLVLKRRKASRTAA